MSMWSTVAVNTKDKYSGQWLCRFPCYHVLDNSRATELHIFFLIFNPSLYPTGKQKFDKTDLCLVNYDLHWLKILISVVERPDNGFRIHHHHVLIRSKFFVLA